MHELEQLSERIRRHIPVTRSLAFSFTEWQPGLLVMEAPLAQHSNDKGTFFAGSQAALFTLAGWALTTLEAERGQVRADVLATDNQLTYTAPLTSDMVIRVTAAEQELQLFNERLARKGRARLAVKAEGLAKAAQATASSWEGQYLARLIGDS